jgi:hypothetical protein
MTNDSVSGEADLDSGGDFHRFGSAPQQRQKDTLLSPPRQGPRSVFGREIGQRPTMMDP